MAALKVDSQVFVPKGLANANVAESEDPHFDEGGFEDEAGYHEDHGMPDGMLHERGRTVDDGFPITSMTFDPFEELLWVRTAIEFSGVL
jgi:hypothetical protein